MSLDDYPLVDVHAHFVTERYAEAAMAAGHCNPDGMPGWPSWTAEGHLVMMDAHGINTSILSVSSPGTHFGDDAAAGVLSREVNEFAAGLVRTHRGRFGHFASLPLPDVEGSLIEAAYCLDELGSDGVAIETNAHGRYLGSPEFDPLWAELDRRRAVVFVHPTSPPGYEAISMGRPRPMLEFLFDSTRAASDLIFARVLVRYPAISWVFTHGGGALPLLADRIGLFQQLFDEQDPEDPLVIEQVSQLWFDIAGTPFPRQVPALTAAVGTDRVLYGSDYCWTPATTVAQQIASIDAAEPPDGDTWRSLTTRNARRLLSYTQTR